VVDRFPEAHVHYYLLDLLIKISERYNIDGCPGEFVLDLVKLGVPKLLAGECTVLYIYTCTEFHSLYLP